MPTAINFDELEQGYDIEVNGDGIVYQSVLYKAVLAQDGQAKWDRLMACIEDNVAEDADLVERIDWHAVQSDYWSE